MFAGYASWFSFNFYIAKVTRAPHFLERINRNGSVVIINGNNREIVKLNLIRGGIDVRVKPLESSYYIIALFEDKEASLIRYDTFLDNSFGTKKVLHYTIEMHYVGRKLTLTISTVVI